MVLQIILIFIIILFLFLYFKGGNTLVRIKSTIDEKFHYVRDLETDDLDDAANILAEIKIRLEKLVKHIYVKYKDDPDSKFLLNNFNPDNIVETDIKENDTSYSINKGSKISLCIRDKNKNGYPLHDINTLMFVSLHELAHLMTTTYGHDLEFSENFVLILKEAKALGIYDPENYNINEKDYCGIKIWKTPLY